MQVGSHALSQLMLLLQGLFGLLTSGVSVDAAMTSQLRSLNSSERSEKAMISVGHTKVKSLG